MAIEPFAHGLFTAPSPGAAVLAQQHDEWAIGRRYLAIETIKASQTIVIEEVPQLQAATA